MNKLELRMLIEQVLGDIEDREVRIDQVHGDDSGHFIVFVIDGKRFKIKIEDFT